MPNAFISKKHDPKLNSYADKFYISRKLVDVPKKVGEGEEDFIIVKKVVETKQDIQEIIDSQADDVGLDNILKKFAVTGDASLLPQSVNANGGDTIDFTALPQDLIEAQQYYAEQKAKFDALPDAIKKGRDFNTFMAQFNQAEFDNYLASIAPKVEVKETKKEGE